MLTFSQFLVEKAKKPNGKKNSPFKFFNSTVPNLEYQQQNADSSDKRSVDSPSFGSSRAI